MTAKSTVCSSSILCSRRWLGSHKITTGFLAIWKKVPVIEEMPQYNGLNGIMLCKDSAVKQLSASPSNRVLAG